MSDFQIQIQIQIFKMTHKILCGTGVVPMIPMWYRFLKNRSQSFYQEGGVLLTKTGPVYRLFHSKLFSKLNFIFNNIIKVLKINLPHTGPAKHGNSHCQH